MKAFRSIVWVGLTLLVIGCGGSSASKAPQALREMPLPPAPPAVPAVRLEPIDMELREAAKREIRMAALSNDPAIRANAIEAAVVGMGAEAHPIIAKGLSDADAPVRFASAMAAGTLKLADLHGQIAGLANDPNERVRIAAIFALHRLGDTSRSRTLEKTAVSPNPRIRRDTAFVLGRLDEPSATKVLKQMIIDPETDVRIEVASSLWLSSRDPWAVELLASGVVSQFADDTMTCLLALAGPKDRRAESHIRSKLTDPYVEVGLVSARALGDLGYDDGYGLATGSLRSTDARQRVLSALALGAIGRSDAQSGLKDLLQDSNPRTRLAAAMALLQLKAPAAAGSENVRL